jgi:hypothetical protein
MSAHRSVLATLCLLPLTLACSGSSLSGDGTAIESTRAGDRTNGSPVLAGQLRSVDPDRETLIVAFGDDLYQFAYTDATEVVGGTANVRGLTGNTGNQITVHYRQNPITSTKTAVKIELQ